LLTKNVEHVLYEGKYIYMKHTKGREEKVGNSRRKWQWEGFPRQIKDLTRIKGGPKNVVRAA